MNYRRLQNEIEQALRDARKVKPHTYVNCSACGQSVQRWFTRMEHTNLAHTLYVEALSAGVSIEEAVQQLAAGHQISDVSFRCMVCCGEAPEYPKDEEGLAAFLLRTNRRVCPRCESWLPTWFYAESVGVCCTCAGARKYKPFRAETKDEYEARFGPSSNGRS